MPRSSAIQRPATGALTTTWRVGLSSTGRAMPLEYWVPSGAQRSMPMELPPAMPAAESLPNWMRASRIVVRNVTGRFAIGTPFWSASTVKA